MYSKAILHFKKADAKLHKMSLEFDIEDVKASDDLFADICRTIIGQQLSGKAADTIFGRFELLFANKKSPVAITPEKILKLSDTEIRACGLSGAKMRAIRNLSEKVLSGEVNLVQLPSLADPEVLVELTKVKGIGPWTAEMILMFSLGRTDVFSHGDLGLRKGLMYLYGWKKLPSQKKLDAVISAWSPYRTYAARVLWRLADSKKVKKTDR